MGSRIWSAVWLESRLRSAVWLGPELRRAGRMGQRMRRPVERFQLRLRVQQLRMRVPLVRLCGLQPARRLRGRPVRRIYQLLGPVLRRLLMAESTAFGERLSWL